MSAAADPVLVEAACALCAARSGRVRFRAGPFRVLACSGCGLTYVTPRVADEALIERVYGAAYWRSPAARERGYADYLGDAELHLRTFERRRRSFARHFDRPGRVLDVGCAAGSFLAVMARAGWRVRGVEPSPVARAWAARQLGPGVVQECRFEGADLMPESFDLVTFWDVLEHLSDPLAALRRARALLRPGGIALVETQNVDSLAARALGRRWHHYKHLEHLHHFQRATLARAFRAAGLRPLGASARHAGKYVRGSFVVERSARLHSALPRLLRPLFASGRRAFYVNPLDELIALARRD